MDTRFLSAVILVIASVWTTKSVTDGLLVRLSENGIDDISCRELNAAFPCRSLGFALEALKDSSNRNETMFTFSVDAGNVYSLNESVKINQTSTSVIVYLKSSSNSTGGRSIIRCADAKAGIEIGSNTSNTRNINFVDLEFQNCSSRSVAAVVLIWNSRDINFTNCVFRNNTKAGINAFESSVTIQRCHFLNNTSNENNSEKPYIEGVTSAGGGAGFLYQEARNLSLIVKDSTFEFNSAVTNDTSEFVAPTYRVSLLIPSGGGLLVVFRKNAQFCRAWIENTRFAKNSATIGGGLYVEQSDVAMGNHFIMISSNLSGNTAGQAAGGLSLTQWNNASRFTTVFKNCIVSENEAQRGAGMNVFFMNSDATYSGSVLRSVRGLPVCNEILGTKPMTQLGFLIKTVFHFFFNFNDYSADSLVWSTLLSLAAWIANIFCA